MSDNHGEQATVEGQADEPMAYIGRWPCCGIVSAMTADEPEYKRHVAKEVASMLRGGMQVQRVTVEEARRLRFGRCACGRLTK